MATVTVDQAKLVLNAFAATFQNELLSSDLVTWKQFNGEMNDRDKLTVVEQVVPRYLVTQTVNGVASLQVSGTPTVQDTAFGSEQYTVNRTFNTNMGWGDFVKVRDIGDARESEAIKGAAQNLAEQIDRYIIGFVGNVSNNYVATGTGAAATVSTFDQVASAYTRLKAEGVTDSDLKLVLTYADRQALASNIVYPQSPQTAANLGDMGTTLYRNGFEGKVAGFDTMFTQQLQNITTGTRLTTGATMNAAAQNVHYAAVCDSGAPGQFLSQTINITGVGTTATVNDGEVFTIAGVFAYDNRAQQALDYLQQFRVIGNYTAVAGVIAAMRVFPAIIVPDASSNFGTAAQDTASATVSVVPGATAAIVFVGSPSTVLKPRFIAQKQAVICNTVDLITPSVGEISRKALTRVPLSVRMWRWSDFTSGDHSVRFDVALTANVRDRRRAIRLGGVTA